MSITTLSDAIAHLPSRDLDFAKSLLAAQSKPRGLSERQEHFVGVLIERANKAASAPAIDAPRETVAIGDFAPMIALFDRAAEHLKHPAIALRDETAGEIRITRAGGNARVPGSLNVATPGGFGSGTWYGRILQTGTLEKSPRNTPPASLVALLSAFAAAPAKTAADHGRLHGRCCFCAKPLADELSTAVGYGKTCAKRWNMPYGREVAAPFLATAA